MIFKPHLLLQKIYKPTFFDDALLGTVVAFYVWFLFVWMPSFCRGLSQDIWRTNILPRGLNNFSGEKIFAS